MSKSNSVNYFLKLLELVNPNSADVDNNSYSCIGSSYHYSSKPLISQLSAILKGKIMADMSISANCSNALGCVFEGNDLFTKHLSRTGIVPEIVRIEDNIQKIFDDNAPIGEKINSKIAKKIAPDYKKEQEEIGKLISSQETFELKGGGSLVVGANYNAANIYKWKKEETGYAVISLEAHLNPQTVIPENITETYLAELACNSLPDNFTISVEGVGDIQKNGDRLDVFIRKI